MSYKEELDNNKKLITSIFGAIPETSGIYIFARKENGFKYAYVGQAKHLLTRIAEHLQGYQYIDLSIKNHGLKTESNPNGYTVRWLEFPEDRLNDEEQYYIKLMANSGWQLRNKTAGGQNQGKFEIAETKPKKTYREGLKQGEINALRRVKELFDKYLNFEIKEPCNKVKQRKKEEFEKLLWGLEDGGTSNVCKNDS